jgi:hypothetical protein
VAVPDQETINLELEAEEADEAGFSTDKETEDALESPWVLAQAPIFNKPFDEVVIELYDDRDTARTGIKYLPVGLLTYWRRLKARKRKSLKTIQYHNSRHGYTIAVHDSRIKELAAAYTNKCKEAETLSDVVALRQLEQKNESVEFVNPMKYATSIILPKDMEGALASLSAAIGISNVKLYCWLCILSLMTLKGDSGLKVVLQKEIEQFWKIVETRLKGLK